MMRSLVLALSLALVAGCHKDPDLQPQHAKSEDLPPLPPSTGTPVGYLIDARDRLALSADQLSKLKAIDASLAAQNESIDTQIRAIEKPPEEEPPEKGAPPKRINHAPGVDIKATPDSQKLHAAHDANDRDALKRVFALLEPKQLETAKQILTERGVALPGAKKSDAHDDSDGAPLPTLGSGQH